MDKQLVLIDTAGRSQYNSEQLDELRSLLTASEDIEKHLGTEFNRENTKMLWIL